MTTIAADTLGPAGSTGHVCLVFDSEHHRRAEVTAWVLDGLAAGDRVMSIEDPGHSVLLADLAAAGADPDRLRAEGRLVLTSPEEGFFHRGRLDLAGKMRAHRELVERAVDDGYQGLRRTAPAALNLELLHSDQRALLEYESRFERLSRVYPVSALCQYPRFGFEGELLTRACEAHPRYLRDVQLRAERAAGALYLTGEVDHTNAHLLGGLLRGGDPDRELLIDASALAFIDASGLRTLAEAEWELRGGHGLRLRGASRALRGALRVCGYERWLEEAA